MTATTPGPPPATNRPLDEPWTLGAEEVLRCLGTTDAGLDEATADRILLRDGPNALPDERRRQWPALLLGQFRSPLVLLLLAAAAAALVVGQIADAATIATIVVLNALLGFIQEWRADRAIGALTAMLAPTARVMRNGQRSTIAATKLVLGDIVELEPGDVVPADVRLLLVKGLEINEAALTGESLPLRKDSAANAANTPLAERTAMAFSGTAISAGRGSGIVVATGTGTQFGLIAGLAAGITRQPTTLERALRRLARQLGIASVGVAALVLLAGWLGGYDPQQMAFTAIALMVALVPEGLPTVVTVSLALGVRAMARRRALLRNLQAAETLGATSIICTDKTGTLTEGQMAVRYWWQPADCTVDRAAGDTPGAQTVDAELLLCALQCSHATVSRSGSNWSAQGAATEAALAVAAAEDGAPLERIAPIEQEWAFDSVRKRMTVVTGGAAAAVWTKGAPEMVLPLCRFRRINGESAPLDDPTRQGLETTLTGFMAAGLRVLAFAGRSLAGPVPESADDAETGLVLLGLACLHDPCRAEVPEAVRVARDAGVRVIMITGDAPATGQAIAAQAGIDADTFITGPQLDALDKTALAEQLARGTGVFARVAPEHKLRIVEALQAAGSVVAMTGDGVNDAPALRQADVGIAMGIRGTEVARQSADIVLTDDNFASIVSAIREGRRQYQNIRRFVCYLLSSNFGEVIAIALALLLGLPLILLPVQILWMNLVTDGMTAIALGLERATPGLMRSPPRKPGAVLLGRSHFLLVAAIGAWIGLSGFVLFRHALTVPGTSLAYAQTVAFTAIIVMEKFNVLNFRSLRTPLRDLGLTSNPWVLTALSATLLLQVAVVYLPFFNSLLHTVPLSAADWGRILAVAAPVFLVPELLKQISQRRRAA